MAAEIAARLRDQILSGGYPVGEPLNEVEIARSMGVSRVPLREALHRLEGERIVTIRPNRGAEVTRLTGHELQEIAEGCRMLEGHCLRLSAPNLGLEALARTVEVLDELDRIDDPLLWSRKNWEFHAALYSAAQRPLLLELIGSLRARGEIAMLRLVAERSRRASLNQEHRRLVEHLRERRHEQAFELLDAHLQGGKEKALPLIEVR
jgi:DNA-binding GntR family transcriptional regulator